MALDLQRSCPMFATANRAAGCERYRWIKPKADMSPLQFHKRSQLFIRSHVSARSVMRSNSPRTRVSPVAVPETQSVFRQRAR